MNYLIALRKSYNIEMQTFTISIFRLLGKGDSQIVINLDKKKKLDNDLCEPPKNIYIFKQTYTKKYLRLTSKLILQ